MWNLDMVEVNLFAKQSGVTDVENKLMVTNGGRGGMNWEIGIDICTLICIK